MTAENKSLKYIRWTSIIFFILSLTQKAYCTSTHCSDSIMVFLLGWAAVFSTGAGICWFANPLLFISWGLLKKNLKVSAILAALATLLSLLFLLFDSITDNEGGIPHQIISYRAGYWLWLSSSLCILIGTFILRTGHDTKTTA
ncbi:MAG: hypothetical protein QM791_03850 [Ferruginibacter sp.]